MCDGDKGGPADGRQGEKPKENETTGTGPEEQGKKPAQVHFKQVKIIDINGSISSEKGQVTINKIIPDNIAQQEQAQEVIFEEKKDEKEKIEQLKSIKVKFSDADIQLVSINVGSDKSLGKLRDFLKNIITDSDRFLIGKAAVTPESEFSIEIRQALSEDSTIEIKRQAESERISDATRAEILKLDAGKVEKGKFDLSPHQIGSAASNANDSYAGLTNDQRKILIENCGANRGILMQGDKIEWSPNPFLAGKDISLDEFETHLPQQSYQSNQYVASSRSDIESQSNLGISASAKASFWGTSAEAEGKYSQANSSMNTNESVHSSTELLVPKLELTLRKPKVNEQCKADLAAFEGRTGESWDDFALLRAFFRNWGAYIPITTVIGGKLALHDEKTLTSRDEAKKWAASARVAFNARVASGSAAYEQSESKAKTSSDQSMTGMLTSTGGDPALAQSPGSWAASLGSWQYWKPCRVSDYRPIYSFGSKEAKQGIYRTLWFWHDLWRNDPMMIDLDHYLFTLARELSPITLPEPPADLPKTHRASVRAPAVASFKYGSFLFAERGGRLHCMLLRGNEATEVLDRPLGPDPRPATDQKIRDMAQALNYKNAYDVRSSPIASSNGDGTKVIVAFAEGESRNLLCIRLEFEKVNNPDNGKRKFQRMEIISGSSNFNICETVGDPVMLSYFDPAGNLAFGAVRNDDAIHVFKMENGDISAVRKSECRPERARFYGQFSGFVDHAKIINLFVPTSPVENYHQSGTQDHHRNTPLKDIHWGSRTLPRAHPSGSLAAVETRTLSDDNSQRLQNFHVFVPGGSKLLYLHGLDSWEHKEIPTSMRRPVAYELGDRIAVLGRVGQQLQSFSIDIEVKKDDQTYRLKVKPVVKPVFASGITGDPVLFEARSPAGERSLSAVVPYETDKLLWLWYDHGKDEWTMLPP